MHAKITITTPLTQKIYDVFAKLIYTENIPVPIGTVAVIKAVKNANTLSLFSSGNICNKKASKLLSIKAIVAPIIKIITLEAKKFILIPINMIAIPNKANKTFITFFNSFFPTIKPTNSVFAGDRHWMHPGLELLPRC